MTLKGQPAVRLGKTVTGGSSSTWLCTMEGTYTYTSSEGYDDFLSRRGVPWIGRKLIIAAPVELRVSHIKE